ncbi:hypothetical protein ACOI1C_00370 [Bacillus sp. DJP31]|uniref:hypothetical protein n=1 Tax=Bacillus sp. DJP31 TaxID=3409789 RepID=UPI003BB4FAA8
MQKQDWKETERELFNFYLQKESAKSLLEIGFHEEQQVIAVKEENGDDDKEVPTRKKR